jgi:hypothetical protein
VSYRRGLGWAGYIPDIRSQKYAYAQVMDKEADLEIPDAFTGWIPFIFDQENLGSCGPCSAITMTAAVMVQNGHTDWIHLSPLALYYYVREAMGTTNSDSGVYNRVMLEIMRKRGIPAGHLWPYVTEKWNTPPSAEANADAEKHQILEFNEINSLEEALHALAAGRGLITGCPVYESFEDVNSSNNIIPMPGRNEKMLGGHDMYYFGYHKKDKYILVLNSWGTGWGKRGVAAMPFEYFEKLTSDTWTITKMEDSGNGG